MRDSTTSLPQARTQEFREALGTRVLVADGAMGTALLARRTLANRSLDELNLSLPALVRDVHREFIGAGAEIIETNTFGANRARLAAFGFGDRVRAVNLAGVRIAREAARDAAFVAGAVGPLGVRMAPWGAMGAEEARALFREQIDALVAAGVDLLMLETFRDLEELHQAVLAARESAGEEMVVIAQVSVEEDGLLIDGTAPEDFAQRMDAWAVDGIGVNCSSGPRSVLETIERMAPYTTKALCAMPNAGLGATPVSPRYLRRYAVRFLRAGVRIVGGCCGAGPEHIRAIASELRGFEGEAAEHGVALERVAAAGSEPVARKSGLGEKLSAGRFVTLVEMLPPVGADASREIAAAKELGVDAVLVGDRARGMGAAALCSLLERAGAEAVLRIASRGRSAAEMQGELLGAHAAGIRNIVCTDGGLVHLAQRLNRGLDLGGNALGSQTALLAGMLVNPAAETELEDAVKAGAEFVVTEPVFDAEMLDEFLRRAKGLRVPVIVGVRPLRSVRDAEYMMHERKVPVPAETITRLSVEPEAGVAIAREMAELVHGKAAGVAWSGMEVAELH